VAPFRPRNLDTVWQSDGNVVVCATAGMGAERENLLRTTGYSGTPSSP